MLQWENNKYCVFWVCVCSLMYPARNTHAPCCHLWSAPTLQYFFFSTLSHKRHDFRRNFTKNKICVFIFSTTFVRKISHSKKNSARCDKKINISLHVKYRLFLSDLNESLNFRTYFREKIKYQIPWKSLQRKMSFSRRTDRQIWRSWQLIFAIWKRG